MNNLDGNAGNGFASQVGKEKKWLITFLQCSLC